MVVVKQVIMFKMTTPNPGGLLGEFWDDKGRTGIAQIFISHGEKIHSLQFQFVENATLVLSEKHGYDHSAPKFNAVKLNYPSELLIGIRGSYSSPQGKYGVHYVTSIIFTTNNASYGPFGCHAQGNLAFDFQIGAHNKCCGFHGTSGMYLQSIGVFMDPMATLSNVKVIPEKDNVKNESH